MKNKQQLSFRNLYTFSEKLPIDLSLSENPLGCSPSIAVALKQLTQADFFDYPDPDCSLLRRAISKQFQISTESIFVANGSEAIIKLLGQILVKPKDEVIIPKLTFPMFEVVSKMNDGEVILSDMKANFGIDLSDVKSKITPLTKMIVICNPNNPTGRTISKRKIIELAKITKASIIVDEANIEFGGETIIGETEKFSNLIVLRTFSKGFGLAGFRIGFCVANTKIIQLLGKTSQPFPVSTVAEKAALAAFEDKNFLKKTKDFMKEERGFLTRELKKERVYGSKFSSEQPAGRDTQIFTRFS